MRYMRSRINVNRSRHKLRALEVYGISNDAPASEKDIILYGENDKQWYSGTIRRGNIYSDNRERLSGLCDKYYFKIKSGYCNHKVAEFKIIGYPIIKQHTLVKIEDIQVKRAIFNIDQHLLGTKEYFVLR